MPSAPASIPVISPQPPEAFTGIELEDPKAAAAGVPAVMNSLKHVYGSSGLMRGTSTMLNLNQWEGFDCQRLRLAGPGGPPQRV